MEHALKPYIDKKVGVMLTRIEIQIKGKLSEVSDTHIVLMVDSTPRVINMAHVIYVEPKE